MAQENLEIVRRFTAAVNDRRVPEELLAPEFSMQNVTTAVTERTYRGPDGVREWISDFFDVLDPGARHEAEPLATGPDYVVARLRFVGQGAVSGAPVDLRFYGVAWVRDGKITRAVGYASRREALEAVGLRAQAMARKNVEIVESLLAAWNNGTLEDMAPFVAEDIEWVEVEGRPELEGGEFRGQVRVQSMLESLFDTWEHYRLEPASVRAVSDDRVVAIVREVARGRASGASVESLWGYVMTLRDGKLARVDAYRDPDDALEAVRPRD